MAAPFIDVTYPVLGTTLPVDHSYALYTALTKVVPAFHAPAVPIRFAAISGLYAGKGLISVDHRSRLRVRLLADILPTVLPLSGQQLRIGSHRIQLGVPQVRLLVPASTLVSRLVTFKNSTDPTRFLEVARAKLNELAVEGTLIIPAVSSGSHAGEPRRRVIRIKGKSVIGYALHVGGLSQTESLRLQEAGLGGRTRIGCGFFVPLRNEALAS